MTDWRAETVAVLAPTGGDGAIAQRVLAGAGFTPAVCADMESLCATVHGAGVGAVIVAEEALIDRARERLLATLDAEPSWSDMPLVLLTGDGALSRDIPPALAAVISRANVTLLERPVRVATLVTTLRSALRARQRQFDVRDHLEERRDAELSLRAAREQAEEARRAAEEANRSKSEFLATMSHELRTPLNAIAGYTQLLSLGVRGPVTEEQKVDLQRIDRSQRHLLSLINDVLNFARIDAGHVRIDIAPVRIGELVRELDAFVAPQLEAKSLRYFDEGAATDVVALADEDKTRQIVLNLLSNAVKFTPAGGEIRVECEVDGDVVRTTVRDSGMGIPDDRLESIFEPFVQLERGFTSAHAGTGLGLSISRNLARQMGGELSAESVVGQGSAFTLTLPRA